MAERLVVLVVLILIVAALYSAIVWLGGRL